jgi:hypothetical protein
MKRLTFGSTSCAFSAAALLGLAWMGFCRLMIAITPPGGSGEFRGIAHLGWRLGIFLMIGMIPVTSLIGFSLGLVGTARGWADQRQAVAGFTLNGLVLLLSPFVYHWAMSVLDSTQ